jgi:hypothetical protein
MHIRNLVALLLALTVLTACNINVQAPLSDTEQAAAATIVAQTMQAVASAQSQPLASPAAVLATPTYSKPVLSITGDSNCRTGPGGSFEVVTSFTPGTSLDLVGHNTANNYWEVKIPNSEETCWVWGQYATATGSFESLPESAAPAAAGAGSPNRPAALYYSYKCENGSITTDLSWSDSADNETGYRVYRFDQLVVDLPEGSTSYTDTEPLPAGTFLQYGVAAYNSAGESAKRIQEFTACP